MSHLSPAKFLPLAFLNESSVNQALPEEISLCENGNMIFYWADFCETCDVIKNRLENDSEMMKDFRVREVTLNRLSGIPAWIRTQKKVHQTTMFDLYELYIFDRTQLKIGIDPFEPVEISLISSTGPFRSMAVAECFNKSIYKDFVMLYLLKDMLPKRDYRLRLKAKVLLEYGPDFSKASLIDIEQLTMSGLLLSVDSDFFINQMQKMSSLRMLIDTQCLKEACTKELNEIKSHLSKFAFNLMYSSKKEDAISFDFSSVNAHSRFDFIQNKKIYLFVAYDKLHAFDKDKVNSIIKFVAHTKALISDHYKLNFMKKSA